ncbi:dicarboxylate/amino acid:cation symporter [Sedimentibacter saalensis]|jgi:Na+/H+-dicarboxylate symporter|uniref:Na+/H+-dicarboxylate symporter n=1 Tax=Sedimentibacter saalensis TaxID=130788 RepID=A0A562JLX2_9FIRM|nr:dicarboxylate/amino acid:cation symporter [Sedimentibacter saalensis]MEA5095957.1 dicarboxylate/amino acid:cation symporter [Sedimentibacter saalensis]TWH83854.1 Na+/H+-dicarboxylate symporter [Sedimentibacter saalensis]
MAEKKFKLGLISKIIIGIIVGLILGSVAPSWINRIFVTFSSIFGNFLGFIIPLLILGFVTAGIAELGTGAGKLLGITVGIAYGFTLISGFAAYFVASTLLPTIITPDTASGITEAKAALEPYFTVQMPAIMQVVSALILAFILGLGISAINNEPLRKAADGFQKIITKVIESIVIPLLPYYIVGVFVNMTYTGQVATVFSVFWKVFLIVIAMHLVIIVFQFAVGCSISKKNLFKSLRIQVTGYMTALGTQSSAATIPVNLQCSERMNISKGIREFVIPLCATTHMSGSTITLTTCAMSVMLLNGYPIELNLFAGFIAMLGITIVAAPGVPGGAVMASLGLLELILGFTEPMLALMIALYIAQDSFGTACNVSGDQAVAMIVDTISKE